jgi:hypothetical protein
MQVNEKIDKIRRFRAAFGLPGKTPAAHMRTAGVQQEKFALQLFA